MNGRLKIVLLSLALAACGRTADLEPAAGQSLPQKPAMASKPLTAEQLLALPTHADPERTDELNTKGAIRQVDRFDLPPPEGEAVPPVGGDQPQTPSTTGPDNQEPQRR